MADPYAAFSSVVPTQTTAPPAANDPYAAFSSPVEEEQGTPPVSAMDRVNAVASGVNRGVAGLAGLPVDTMANLRDIGKSAIGGAYLWLTNKEGDSVPFERNAEGLLVPTKEAHERGLPSWLEIGDRSKDVGSGENIANALDSASVAVGGSPVTQLPRPDDAMSRYLYAAGQSAPGVAVGRPTGMSLRTATASNVGGGVAAQTAAELGAGPGAQALAGMVTGAAIPAVRPSLAGGVKKAFRGGEEGRLATGETINDFERAGSFPSAGQATGRRAVQATESMLAKTPGGAGRMAAVSEREAGNLGTNIEKLASNLAPKSSAEQAGRAITKGVTGEDGFIQTFKAKSSKNYDALDVFVKKDQPFVMQATQKALAELTTPIAGAEKTSKFFINSKISSIKEALDADLAAGQNAIPYEAAKKIRSIVGEQLADAPFNGDVPRSQWKKLYSAMSSDLEANAKTAGPDAQAALRRANTYHAAGMKRLDVISSVIDKNGGPEAVFRAATSGAKEGATTLRAVMQSLPKDAQKMLTAGVLRRLGRATAGKQDDLGEKFSTETFLTNWNTMSKEAKATLFDRYGPGFRGDMDAVAKVASNLRDGSKVFQNPSGTGQAGAQATIAASVVLSVLHGNFGTATLIGSGVGVANLTARLLTKPRFVKWLATTTKVPPKALPALLVQLETKGDEDEKEFAKLLREQGHD